MPTRQPNRGQSHVPARTGITNAAVTKQSQSSRVPVLDLGDGNLVALRDGATVNIQHPHADICIVFDTTGSMSDKIDGLIDCMAGFVSQLGRLNLDWRISILPFGDLTVQGDRVDAHLPFVKTVAQAKQQLREMPRFLGGGNDGESSIEAVLGAIEKPWRKGAVRVIVLLTDEPALGVQRSQTVLGRLRSKEIITFVASPNRNYFKAWAAGTGGKWFEIGPSMDTRALLNLLRRLVKNVATVAAEVHAIAGGNYEKYLQITSGDQTPRKHG
jgi:hypothetical protein